MQKIRFSIEYNGVKYYYDQLLPFIPMDGDHIWLPATEDLKLGLFTAGIRRWAEVPRSRTPSEIINVPLTHGDRRYIPGPRNLASTKGWVAYQGQDLDCMFRDFVPCVPIGI